MFGSMFERRTRLILLVIVIASVGMLVRAGQVQIAQGQQWREAAAETLRRSTLTDTTRGRILDTRGRILAEDVPCKDAAVAYWFIQQEPDPRRLWHLQREIARGTPGYYEAETAEQIRRVEASREEALATLERMWETLAEVGGISREEIEATRRGIVARTEMRRREVVQARYRRAVREHEEMGPGRWWRRWVLGEAAAPPGVEQFDEPIAEELQAHVILPNITTDQYNRLRKMEEELPGLVVRASRTRHYPYGNAVAHVVGRLSKVLHEDLADDPNFTDELRKYYPNDLIGAEGLERVAEQSLRGVRGRIDYDREHRTTTVAYEPEAGGDVRGTIDVDLQRDIRAAFLNVAWKWPAEGGHPPSIIHGPAPGAAVVIDVRTGAVRALVSYPDFDPNTFAQDFPRLNADDINRPLTNRATLFSAVPGSTIKPIIGIAAITDGLIRPDGTIECDGYLRIDGRVFTNTFRCWTASMFASVGDPLRHHQNYSDPHPTPGLNPRDPQPGHLTFADALQRSCNIYFEVLGHRMGEEKLTEWMKRFGLGQTIGIGLPERSGLLLSGVPDRERRDPQAMLRHTLFASIGQGYVQATPVQMANVAATFARDGVWVRPTLIEEDTTAALAAKIDLQLDRQGLDRARRGLRAAVVEIAGTGNEINRYVPVAVAGKTGTAQAHLLEVVLRDEAGQPILGEDGSVQRVRLEHGVRDRLNPLAPWYRRINPTSQPAPRQSHGWFIGYAPADDPQIAFAVFVEYGGSGGTSAGSVAAEIIRSAARHGYITPTREPDPRAAARGELMYRID